MQLQSEQQEPIEVVELKDPKVPPHRLHGKQPMPSDLQPSKVPFAPASEEYSPSIGPALDAGGEMSDLDLGDLGASEEPGYLGSSDLAVERAEGRKRKRSETKKPPKMVENDDTKSPETAKTVKRVGNGDVSMKWTRVVSRDMLESMWNQEHEHIQGLIGNLMNQVPVGGQDGWHYGEELHLLTQGRQELETVLSELEKHQEASRNIRLCGLNVDEQTDEGPGEVLQTVVVSLDEVRKDLDGWRAAMESEYQSLTVETKAIEPVDLGDLNDEDIELVPGKLVCTLKAGPNGGRKKCRGVICGNMVNQSVDPAPWGPYASGADGLLIRSTVMHGVQQGWGLSLADVKTAFLLAPRPKPEGAREVIVVPPKVLVQAGVCQPTERWRVHRALYGFPSSPARWSVHRDGVLEAFEWEGETSKFTLQHTPEGNLWKVMSSVEGGEKQCVGHVLVYVDDVMVIAPRTVREGFMARLKREWNISNPETVTDQGGCVFAVWSLGGRIKPTYMLLSPPTLRIFLKGTRISPPKLTPCQSGKSPQNRKRA